MKNPFERIFGNSQQEKSGQEMVNDKEKELARLREWRREVEFGTKMESVPQDREQLDKIDEQIRRLEQGE